MREYLIDLLCCPECQGDLKWTITERNDDVIEEARSKCADCGRVFLISHGIGVFLATDPGREDLWQDVESNLMRSLREDPALYKALMQSPVEALNPADKLYRAMVLEEEGEFAGAESVEKLAHQGLYAREYLGCWTEQVDFLVNKLDGVNGPVIDLASGRCYLVKELAQRLDAPIVASDFSIQVMKRNRQWLEFHGLNQRVSLLLFDARQSPFKTGSIKIGTSNVGLPNIREAANFHRELRRVVSGRFLAISHFYKEEDANAMVIDRFGLGEMLYERLLVGGLSEAGFRVRIENRCRSEALPTPAGEVLKDAQIDGLPVAAADIDWCVLEAS